MSITVQSILVPVDGSGASEQALPWAIDLAARYGANLNVLRVCPHPNLFTAQDLVQMRAYYQEQEELADKYLKDLAARWLPEHPRLSLSCAVGNPSEVILIKAEELATSLIVMTSHARDGMSRWFMGSVAEKVARHANCPVMLVRPPH